MLGQVSVSNDLGVDDGIGTKDAFHVPCIYVCSDQQLKPGDWVKFENAYKVVRVIDIDERDGIVDPFIPLKRIIGGKGFWVMLEARVVADFTHTFRIKGMCDEDDKLDEIVNNLDDEENGYNSGCRNCN